MEQQYFTTKDLTQMFGKNRATIWRWGKAGKLPPPTHKFGNPMWSRADIDNLKEAV